MINEKAFYQVKDDELKSGDTPFVIFKDIMMKIEQKEPKERNLKGESK